MDGVYYYATFPDENGYNPQIGAPHLTQALFKATSETDFTFVCSVSQTLPNDPWFYEQLSQC